MPRASERRVADVKPAVTVTDAGAVSAALFVFVNATTAPPGGAAFVKVTVQPLDALDPRMLGLQLRLDTVAGAVTVRPVDPPIRSEEHTSELQSLRHLVC